MFCKYCGNELLEQAVVCTKCGCLVHNAEKTASVQGQPSVSQSPALQPSVSQTVEAQPVQPSRKGARKAKVFSIIGLSFGGVSLLCSFFFFFLMWLGFAAGNEGGIILVLLSMFPLLGAYAVSPVALLMGILAFVFKQKATQPMGAMPTVAFVVGIIAFALGWGMYLSMVFYGV